MYKSSELHYRDHLFPQSQLNNIQSKINPHPPNIWNSYIGKHSNFHCCHYIVAVQGQRQNYESLNGNFKTHSFNPGFSNFYIHKMSIGIPWESSCNGQWACGSHLMHLSFCLLGFYHPSHQALPQTTQFCLEGCFVHLVWHPAQADDELWVRERCSLGQETWCEIWLVGSLEWGWFVSGEECQKTIE